MPGPRDALAGLDATSPSNPIVVSLAEGRYLPDECRLTAGDGAGHGKAAVRRAQAVIVVPPPPPVAAAPADDPALATNYISRALQGILANQPDEPRPIDKTQWAGDHQAIKKGIGAGPADDVRTAPVGEVWSQSPDGSRTTNPPGIMQTEASRVAAQAVIGRDKGDYPDGQYGRDPSPQDPAADQASLRRPNRDFQ